MTTYDAIVIGSGHNGLVAAVYLANAGRSVLVLERNETAGGAIRSGEITRPGFVHDLYSTNQNLFLGSPFYDEFGDDLKRHGLRFARTDTPFCNVFPDGTALRVYSDADRTLDELRQHSEADAAGWQTLHDMFHDFQQTLLPLYYTELPSSGVVPKLAAAVRAVGLQRVVELTRLILHSTRELGDAYFETREMKALMATWGMHLDFGPDVSGGTMFPLLEAYSDMEQGISIVEGGASKLSDALVSLIHEKGGEVRTSSEVTRVLSNGRRATGVELAGGEQIWASEAVIANLVPDVLFGKLLADEHLPNGTHGRAQRFQHGPGTMMIHLALSQPPQWAAGDDIGQFGYVHIAPYVEDLARTYTDSVNGILPASPLLIVGQTTAVDPSRTPDDGAILWIQVRTLPREISGDADGEISATDWDDVKEDYANRLMARLEQYAPGIGETVLQRVVYSPKDLERHNPNLIGGDSIGGSHHLFQNFIFRPFLGSSRYEMPLEHLYMVGASTWPGGGNNAGSGMLGAQQVLQDVAAEETASPLLVGGAVASAALAGWWLLKRRGR